MNSLKVKDLIKQLQKCDPESYVNNFGVIPYFAYEELSYYDGPYSYIENDVWHETRKCESTGKKTIITGFNEQDFIDYIIEIDEEKYLKMPFDEFLSLHFKFDNDIHFTENFIKKIKTHWQAVINSYKED